MVASQEKNDQENRISSGRAVGTNATGHCWVRWMASGIKNGVLRIRNKQNRSTRAMATTTTTTETTRVTRVTRATTTTTTTATLTPPPPSTSLSPPILTPPTPSPCHPCPHQPHLQRNHRRLHHPQALLQRPPEEQIAQAQRVVRILQQGPQ